MTDKKPKKPKSPKMKFKFDSSDDSSGAKFGMNNILEEIRGKDAHAALIQQEALSKSVEPVQRMALTERTDRNKVAFSSKQSTPNGVVEKSFDRIKDEEQKSLAQWDPYISAIISRRCANGAVIGRPSDTKFDKGTRMKDLNPPKREAFESDDEYKKAVKKRETQMKLYMDWVMHCGHYEPTFLNATFYAADQMWKTSTFSEYIVAQIRNLLTFGRYGTQIFRDEAGIPLLFRPVPIETIQPLHVYTDAHVSSGDETYPQSKTDAEEFNSLEKEDRPPAYVQHVDGKKINFFTDEDLKVSFFQKQALWDLRGYPLSPIELAIYMVFIHQQTLGYIRNQFIKGIATKSFITIESTDPSYTIGDEELDELRRDFHNYILRTDNSAVTPVLAGPIKVNVQSFHATPRDMEFLQLEDHIIRAICAAFQISPHEMGYGNLGSPEGGISQSGRQEEMIRGEEAGLRSLLDVVFDDINEILSQAFEGFSENFRLIYVGVGEDTRSAVIQRSVSELQTTATMNSLFSDSDRNDSVPFGGDVPLAGAFQSAVISKLTYAEFRYYFLKDKEALNNPLYDFIIDPSLNQAYQAERTQTIEMRRESAKLQLDSQKQQVDMGNQQMQQAQQQAEQQAQMQTQQDQEVDQQEGDQAQKSEEEPESTLKDAWNGRKQSSEPMTKSKKTQNTMEYYFSSWMKAQEKD
jgi:Phage portal protein